MASNPNLAGEDIADIEAALELRILRQRYAALDAQLPELLSALGASNVLEATEKAKDLRARVVELEAKKTCPGYAACQDALADIDRRVHRAMEKMAPTIFTLEERQRCEAALAAQQPKEPQP